MLRNTIKIVVGETNVSGTWQLVFLLPPPLSSRRGHQCGLKSTGHSAARGPVELGSVQFPPLGGRRPREPRVLIPGLLGFWGESSTLVCAGTMQTGACAG